MLLLFLRHVFVTIQPDLVISFLVEPIGCWASTVGRLQEARRHSQGLAELELPFFGRGHGVGDSRTSAAVSPLRLQCFQCGFTCRMFLSCCLGCCWSFIVFGTYCLHRFVW